ncbi:hypothetical protein IW140_000332 [Coemansia sp. RSA 1813]|nr:hypothetical protein EV178_000533 [Coemansia sp. RSA 1646]KAJ1773701.1 hypothetical protein LPJ74_000243 [Coemansia sp. RSA 1843]KAJ2093662.1 hypothetical protein IW138_000056 [Coemansia sp. RSA 986]KAJ2217875.1 hypothetical protein EV179_000018 [Coemansia sp. RSA 487]KAJ2573287.1 hypothetical protein IW140_000332 [Coemansia sp. RSA 1813]
MAPNGTQEQPSRQQSRYPTRTGGEPNNRRAGAARLNVGSTLQSSLAPGSRRRRSTAAGTATGLWMANEDQRMSIQQASLRRRRQQEQLDDAESINYDDLSELFREEDEPTPVVKRVDTEALASARLSAFSAQRAGADGTIQAPPTMRQMIGLYLDSSAAGRRWDQLDAALNTGIVALYVASTTHVRTGHMGVPYWSLVCQAVLSGLLLVQFIPRYLLAPDPLEYLRSMFSAITLITALTPILVVVNIYLDPSVYKTFMSSGTWVFLYPAIFWRLQPALLRCLVPIKNVYRMSAMTRNVLRALTTVFTTVLAITVLTHVMVYYQNKDKNDEIQGFDEAFFFIAVSSITGLSSDIEPDTWFTRSVVLFVMFIGIFWLPPRVSEMLDLWQNRSPWPSEFEAEANQAHVLVIGDLEYSALFEFLREFFCEDHGIRTVNTVVVLMSEHEPGKEVSELLHDPSYVNRVKFVMGSATSFSQLEDVQANHAQAIFVLSSKAAAGGDATKEDAAKVMVALAIRKFLKSRAHYGARTVPIYAQVLAPETTLHMELLAEHVICVEELRLGLLAKSVMVPGFASLVQLLTTSIPDTTTVPLMRAAGYERKAWLAEYVASMSHEIYATRLSAVFKGMKFQHAAQLVYKRTGATMFALRVPLDRSDDEDGAAEGDEDDGQMLINPVNYECTGKEIAFVIASDSLVSYQIACLTEETTVGVDESDNNNNDEDDNTGETAQLIPGITVGGGASGAANVAGSPLQKHLAATEAHFKAKAPFGMNIMDTVVVAEPARSILDEEGSSSQSHTRDQSTADLIDMDASAKGHHAPDAVLSPELADIEVGISAAGNESDDDARAGDKSDDSDGKRMHRAPLLFNPKHKGGSSTTDTVAVEAGKESGGGYAAGSISLPVPKQKQKDSLAGHVVVCDTSDEFPANIVYLISCIRAAAPSEVAGIAEDSNIIDATSSPTARANPFLSLYEQITRSYNTAQTTASAKAGPFLNMQPIVVLSLVDPTDDQRADLERFGSVQIVHGSPLSRIDLARASIHTARSAIVLANREEWVRAATDTSTKLSLTGSDTTATATVDAPALLSVLNIEALTYGNADFFMTVEFIHRENMQFVGDTETITINDVYAQAFLRPSFMSGRVYAPVMLDTLVCQAYYNSHVLELLQRLIFSHGNVVHALGSAKLDRAGVSMPGLEPESEDSSEAHVFLVDVPSRMYGRKYGSLFAYCCFSHAAIPIGLYRATIHHHQPLWYVVPNPAADCVLRDDDRVYLISAVRPVLQ